MSTSASPARADAIDRVRKYCATEFNAYRFDAAHVVITAPALDGMRPVRAIMAVAASLCRIPRTLADQRAVIGAAMSKLDAPQIDSVLESLLSAGLLREVGAARPAGQPPPVISTVGVLTADRPSALERCLHTYLHHFGKCGRRPRVLVVDHSNDVEASHRNRWLTSKAASAYAGDLEYIGDERRLAMREELLRAGAGRSSVDEILGTARGNTPWGAARNLLLLLTCGEVVLAVNGDTACVPWVPQGHTQSLEVGGHSDPNVYEFFDTRSAAIDVTPSETSDLLAQHERLIGRALVELVTSGDDGCDAWQPCPEILSFVSSDGARAAVRVTATGLAGDVGSSSPHPLLLAATNPRIARGSLRDEYEKAFAFREVRRIVSRPTVTHELLGMGCCAAFDNRRLLPPVAHAASHSDAVYGTTFSRSDPSALFGYVPVGVVHDSGEPSLYSPGFAGAWAVTAASVMTGLIAGTPLSSAVTAVDERMRRIAGHLSDVTALTHDEFDRNSRAMLLDTKARELLWMERAARDPSVSAPWRGAFARYRAAFLRVVESPKGFLPEAGVQQAVANFAAGLREWPDMVDRLRTANPCASAGAVSIRP